jgi:hypothetical protein
MRPLRLQGQANRARLPYPVLRGLDPRIQEGVYDFKEKNSWMAGPSPATTERGWELYAIALPPRPLTCAVP